MNHLYFTNPAGDSSSPYIPGLEVFKALQSAEKKDRPVHYMGGIFNDNTTQALEQEKRMHWWSVLLRSKKIMRRYHRTELDDLWNMMSTRGLEKMSEHIDNKHISTMMYEFERVNPYQKSIMVDKENERIFNHIYSKMEGDTMVAVVNQWHMPAIEYFWRHTTNTETEKEFINPIGDFDINAESEAGLVCEAQQRFMSKNSKSEPTLNRAYYGFYHKFLFEAERHRHVFFEDTADPHLEHGLYNDENKDVKYLKYDKDAHH